jgi:two-component system chemotaxis response regulator CheB
MPIRILLVDDSPLVRSILRELIAREPDLCVVGEAADGLRADEMIRDLTPDVVALDVLMPMMGGLETIRRVMARAPTPILVVAELGGNPQDLITQALMAGAVEVFAKPTQGFGPAEAAAFLTALRRVAKSDLKGPAVPAHRRSDPEVLARGADAVGIVASTGGALAVRTILGWLPSEFPAPVLVVQHTTPGTMAALAEWLGSCTPLEVRVARAGDLALPGTVLLAPEAAHLRLGADRRVVLGAEAEVSGHRPSGTVLLASMARAFGRGAIGVVLTGLGRDGAEGLAELARAGGLALTEDPATAVVAGMPRAALELVPDAVVGTPDRLGTLLSGLWGGRRR